MSSFIDGYIERGFEGALWSSNSRHGFVLYAFTGIGGGRNVSKVNQVNELLRSEMNSDRPMELIEESLSLIQ